MSTYARLTQHLRRLGALDSVADLLGWDEQVMLPPGAAARRAEQCAILAETAHAAANRPEVGTWIAELEADAGLGEEARAVVRQARRDFDRATRLPAEFVRERAAHSSVAYHAWARARADDDFPSYAPMIEKHLELARREAEYLGCAHAPYDCMLDRHDPGMTAAAVDPLFAQLRAGLVPLAAEITEAARRRPPPALGGWPAAVQERFLREVTARIGFDYERGRLDVSLHPFCSGSGDDVRMTTRFREEEPLDSLFSSIHETGHGLYEQGLPAEHWGTALAMPAGMAVHESQSRLWENQVARGRAFWRHFEPLLRASVPGGLAGVDSEGLYRAVNAVAPTPIRVDADEVTYNLHILLRYDIERRLFDRSLAVADLPGVWREQSRQLLGLTPRNDREGVLQDVHWSGGAFGYFPSYTLGNMIAAQLWYAALAARPGLEEEFARGDFTRLLGWLRREVHSKGRRFDAFTLVKRVTGADLSAAPLLRYLRERYGALYLDGAC